MKVAASKSYTAKRNAKCRMQLCKARRHCTLEEQSRVLWTSPMDESGFGVWVYFVPSIKYKVWQRQDYCF